jgi:hypothetical protein
LPARKGFLFWQESRNGPFLRQDKLKTRRYNGGAGKDCKHRAERARQAVPLLFGRFLDGGQETVGVVGHYAVDSSVHQQAHVRALVYGPGNYL